MTNTTQEEARILAWLGERKQAMIDLLREMVDTDSGSYDKAGVDRAGQVLARFHEANGLSVEIVPDARYGDAVKAHLPNPTANDQRPVLLLGHRDTVFPEGEPTRRPFTIRDGRAYGPGVADMKAGLVIEAFVAAAFAANGGLKAPLMMLTTSDEEIASPSSRPVIEAAARESRCVFNAEPSRLPTGTDYGRDHRQSITSGRKGGVFMRAEFLGKAAHSGANYEKGVSAIVDLGHKIPRLQGLTDLEAGVTVNVGLIRRPDRQHRRAFGLVRDRPALQDPGAARGAGRGHPRDRRDAGGRGLLGQADHQGRVPPAGADAGFAPALRHLSRGGRRLGHCCDGGIHRRLCRFRLHRGAGLPDFVQRRPGRRHGPYAGRVPGGREYRPRRRRPSRWR
jgi:hypothetical protein